MGSGTDVARESADVVLLGKDLLKFVEVLKIARRCRRIILTNFAGTLLVDSVGMGFAAFGFLNPVLAAIIHVSSELVFILNSARLFTSSRVPIPSDNPPTVETVALGRKLYYDPILSVDNTVSCASCHSPGAGFSDAKQFSDGVSKKKGRRHAPTVLDAAYYETQFWDGLAPSLEKQAEGPVQNPVEMANALENVEKKLMARPDYREDFEKAFGPGPITYEMVEKSIASFERTLISGNSPFDRYFYGGDKTALSDSAERGLEVFRNPKKGNCATCHTIGDHYALFTDNRFHNIGIGVVSNR